MLTLAGHDPGCMGLYSLVDTQGVISNTSVRRFTTKGACQPPIFLHYLASLRNKSGDLYYSSWLSVTSTIL
jgi:hypothetical protein